MTQVTVATGAELHLSVNGNVYTYHAGDTLYVPTAEVVYLRRDGIIN